jgi:hypothetical protein
MRLTKKDYETRVPKNVSEISGENQVNSTLSRELHRAYFLAHLKDYENGWFVPLLDFDPFFMRHFFGIRNVGDDKSRLTLNGFWWELRPGDKLIDEDGHIIKIWSIGPIFDNDTRFTMQCCPAYTGNGIIFSVYEMAKKTKY